MPHRIWLCPQRLFCPFPKKMCRLLLNVCRLPHNVLPLPRDVTCLSRNVLPLPRDVMCLSRNVWFLPHNVRRLPHDVRRSPHNVLLLPRDVTHLPRNVTRLPHNVTSMQCKEPCSSKCAKAKGDEDKRLNPEVLLPGSRYAMAHTPQPSQYGLCGHLFQNLPPSQLNEKYPTLNAVKPGQNIIPGRREA